MSVALYRAMRYRARGVGCGLLAAMVAAAVGCAGEDPGDLLELECESGQCDLFRGLKDLRDDVRRVDSGDLFAVAGDLATDALNNALELGDFSIIKLGDINIFALEEEARDDHTLGSIDELVDGLARRYGEKALTYEANKLRRDHLLRTSADYYTEASFSVGPDLDSNFSWGLEVGGIDDTSVSVGFDFEDVVEARVIAAVDKEIDGYKEAPLKAIRATRRGLQLGRDGLGFIVPVDSDDVLDMAPGELLAMSSTGSVAMNFGAGIPIFVADPGAISYRVVFNAALRARFKGERMDVQLLRMDGDDVVVDVGVSDVHGFDAKLALRDGWGVAGLLTSRCDDDEKDCERSFSVDVGPVEVDLSKLADKALRRELNRRVDLINAELGGKFASSRVTVARFRFSLERGDTRGDVAKAMTLALKGDLRAAQSLANQGHPGVMTEFDLAHSGWTVGANAGLDLFGMSFYVSREWTEAEAVIQTPDGIMALLLETLHREAGWFFDSHALLATSIAGLTIDSQSPDVARGESNLVVHLAEGDEFMEGDKLLDHYDGMILSLAGFDALRAFEKKANEIQRYVEKNCSTSSAFNSCRVDLQTSDKVLGLRLEAMQALNEEIRELSDARHELVSFIAEKRLDTQAVREYPAQFTGPTSSVTLSMRFDDASINSFAEAGPQRFLDVVTDYLTFVEVDRGASESEILAQREQVVDDVNAEDLRALYADFVKKYGPYIGAEETVLRGLGRVGPRAMEIRFDVDSNDSPKYKEAMVQSIAKRRAELVKEFFKDLRKEAQGHRGSHVAAYTLLRLVPDGHLDVRVDYDVDTSDGWSSVNEPYRAAGYENFDLHAKEQPMPIESEIFDVDRFAQVD